MPRHARVFWEPQQGRCVLNTNWDAINAKSVVHISASEYVPPAPDAHGGFVDENHQRFIGSASITVSNIAPHGPPFDPNNGVTYVVNVDWSEPIPIVVDITVFEEDPTILNV